MNFNPSSEKERERERELPGKMPGTRSFNRAREPQFAINRTASLSRPLSWSRSTTDRRNLSHGPDRTGSPPLEIRSGHDFPTTINFSVSSR